jgi:hypothetical protein
VSGGQPGEGLGDAVEPLLQQALQVATHVQHGGLQFAPKLWLQASEVGDGLLEARQPAVERIGEHAGLL